MKSTASLESPRPDSQTGRDRSGGEALAAGVRFADIHVSAMRPTNYLRSFFHVLSGLMALVCIQHLVSPVGLIWIAGSFASFSWTSELLRRRFPKVNQALMTAFGPVAHDHEWYRVNSGTWYASALLLLALTGSSLVCTLAVVVLAVGDPAAALIGRRFGRIKIRAGRSLEGSLGFLAVAGLTAMGVLLAYYPTMGLGETLALAGVSALAGTLAELYSRWIDDNFSIPVAVGAAVAVTGLVVGTIH
jgi:dolichol kinase